MVGRYAPLIYKGRPDEPTIQKNKEPTNHSSSTFLKKPSMCKPSLLPRWSGQSPASPNNVRAASQPANESLRNALAAGTKPVLLQPSRLRCKRLTAICERPEHRPSDLGQICQPPAVLIGLDMTGAADGESAKSAKIDGLVVETAHTATRLNQKQHQQIS
jgi:hypothetical protein